MKAPIKKRVMYMVLCFILCLYNLANSQDFKKDEEGLIFKNHTFDFGLVRQDTIIEKKFQFINATNDIINLKLISKSCSCTGATLSTNSLKPKQKGFVYLKLDTKDKVGKTNIYVVIESNTEQRYHKVALVGFVQ